MKHSAHSSARPVRHRHAIAIAVSLLGLMPAMQTASAQYYDVSGQVSTYPTNLFPIDFGTSVLDLGTGNTLYVAGNSIGSFSALAGAQLSVGSLTVADGGTGSGSVAVNGGQVLLTGNGNRLQLGNWGTGSLVVSNGGLLDATANSAACTSGNCNNFIGNAAGSTASLTVTGTGSEVRTLRNFIVGGLAVFPPTNGGGAFGTPGGTTHASVNVLAGGTLRTEGASIGQGPGGSAPTGTEKSFADVVIDGVGSQWIVTRNSIGNTAALMGISQSANATATVTVSAGGLLRIDGTGSAGPNDGLNVGSNGQGSLTVAGAGSRVETAGVNTFINVGANNSAGNGDLKILSGATASTLYFNVGRNAGRGVLLIDGAGSVLSQSGVGVVNSGNGGGPAFAHIGRDGGNGQATVSNGASWLISDGGADSRASGSSPGIAIGRGVGSAGSLTISGAGSFVEIVGNSLGPPAGQPDNFNPFFAVGYDNPGTTSGALTITGGGRLILTGNAVSTLANSRNTTLNIGGRNGASGTGSATVTGAGSEIIVQGYDAYIGVGRTAGGSGTLNVLDHAKVSSTSFVVGAETTGTVTVDNAAIALSGYRTNTSPAVGAATTIGRGVGGVGTLNMDHGASLTITPSVLTGGMSIGGDQFLAGGTGAVNLGGGSFINYAGLGLGGQKDHAMVIGRNGVGSMSLSGASVVDISAIAEASVGATTGGVGTLAIASGSTWRGGALFIGGYLDNQPGGTGSVSVSGAGSRLATYGTADGIVVGKTGTGSLGVSSDANVSATLLAVGRNAGSVGTVTVDHSTVNLSGQQSTNLQLGAMLAIGINGSGTFSLNNASQVTVSNTGSAGATLALGGTPTLGGTPGSGVLNVSGGSSITISALPGQAVARIGYDGSGSASFSQGSALNVAGGNVIIAGQPGSTGSLMLNSGSVLNADYVGVGSNPGGIDGGTGSLFINNSTVNTTTLEIGKFGLLGGDGGLINGNVINRGTFSPGNSPGRVKIDGGFVSTESSQILLDVQSDGNGSFQVDTIVLTPNYAFGNLNVTFRFLGNTDPLAAASAGVLDLDNFLRVATATGDSGLSTVFSNGQTWNTLLVGATFSATSSAYNVTDLQLNFDGTGNFSFNATPVAEPSQWMLSLAGLMVLGSLMRRRRSSV